MTSILCQFPDQLLVPVNVKIWGMFFHYKTVVFSVNPGSIRIIVITRPTRFSESSQVGVLKRIFSLSFASLILLRNYPLIKLSAMEILPR